jgi:hypothetical protein
VHTVHLVSRNSGWDPTAIGTIALAAVTFVLAVATIALAWYGKGSLDRTDEALKQTQDELALSRSEVQEAHRPVLTFRSTRFAEWRVGDYGLAGIVFMCENIGAGPAIDVVLRIQLRGDDGRVTTGNGTRWWTGLTMGVGRGTLGEITVAVDGLASLPCFAFELTYADVADQQWFSSGIYLLGRATGTGEVIVVPQVGRVPANGVVPPAVMPTTPNDAAHRNTE